MIERQDPVIGALPAIPSEPVTVSVPTVALAEPAPDEPGIRHKMKTAP